MTAIDATIGSIAKTRAFLKGAESLSGASYERALNSVANSLSDVALHPEAIQRLSVDATRRGFTHEASILSTASSTVNDALRYVIEDGNPRRLPFAGDALDEAITGLTSIRGGEFDRTLAANEQRREWSDSAAIIGLPAIATGGVAAVYYLRGKV